CWVRCFDPASIRSLECIVAPARRERRRRARYRCRSRHYGTGGCPRGRRPGARFESANRCALCKLFAGGDTLIAVRLRPDRVVVAVRAALAVTGGAGACAAGPCGARRCGRPCRLWATVDPFALGGNVAHRRRGLELCAVL